MKTKNYFSKPLVLLLLLNIFTLGAQEIPFNCDFNAYLFQYNDVYALDLASGNSYVVATDVTSGNINATGYNPTDGFIWGYLSSPSKSIVRIGKNFTTTTFTFPELSSGNKYVGDVSSDGIYYIKQGGSEYHRIDLNPESPTYGTYLDLNPLSQSLSIHDWAFNAVDGNLYTVEKNSNHLYRINPATGDVADLGEVPILQGLNYTYGAVYFDVTGRFYVSANQTGTIFVIQNVQDLLIGDPIDSNLFAYGPASSSNDGARCPTAPVPQEICGNGIDDDGDGLIDCDDPSCSGQLDCPTQSASGGNEGGLESNGRLSNKINKRNYKRAKTNYQFNKATANKLVKSTTYDTRNSNGQIELSNLIPLDVIDETAVIESTPIDLLSITNATEIISVDYEQNEERIAALLLIKSEDGVYEHTKYICDRLLGAELLQVSTVEINEVIFIKSMIKNIDGQTEFVLSLSAAPINNDTNFEIESHWNLSSYQNEGTFYNFQIWSNSLENLMKLGQEALYLLDFQKSITSYQTSLPPAVFVKKGAYKNGALQLEIVNRNGSNNIFIEGGKTTTETSSVESFSSQLSLDGSYISEHTVDVGSLFDAGFRISNEQGDIPDDLYLSDGPWGVDDFADSTTINEFNIAANEAEFAEGAYPIERNIKLSASTSEYVSVYRAFSPKFQPVSLEAFQAVAFEAAGTGTLQITLAKEGVSNWNEQLRTTIQLSEELETFVISLDDFSTETGITAALDDVTNIVFTLNSADGSQVEKKLDLRQLRFSDETSTFTEPENTSNELVVAPNPIRDDSMLYFYSENEIPLELSIYNMLGQKVHSEMVQATKGRNSVPFSSNGLAAGIYLFQLSSSGTKAPLSGRVIVPN